MNPATQVVCSFALTLGIPIIVAGWELWHIGPTAWRLPPGEDIPPEPTPLPDAGILPRLHKPLPDCLIPRITPQRALERV